MCKLPRPSINQSLTLESRPIVLKITNNSNRAFQLVVVKPKPKQSNATEARHHEEQMRTQSKYKETTQSASHLVVFDQCEFPYLKRGLIFFLRLFPSYFLTIRIVNYLYCYPGTVLALVELAHTLLSTLCWRVLRRLKLCSYRITCK